MSLAKDGFVIVMTHTIIAGITDHATVGPQCSTQDRPARFSGNRLAFSATAIFDEAKYCNLLLGVTNLKAYSYNRLTLERNAITMVESLQITIICSNIGERCSATSCRNCYILRVANSLRFPIPFRKIGDYSIRAERRTRQQLVRLLPPTPCLSVKS